MTKTKISPPVTPPATEPPSPPVEYVGIQQWIVKPGTGLIRVGSDEARRLIDASRARTATPRDLDIAGVEA